MKQILIYLGFAPSEQDKKLRALVENSYTSLRVVGRGTVRIDPDEVRQSEEFKRALALAREICEDCG